MVLYIDPSQDSRTVNVRELLENGVIQVQKIIQLFIIFFLNLILSCNELKRNLANYELY